MRFYSPKLFLRDPWIFTPFGVGVLSLILATIYTVFNVPKGETTYFLHRTIVFGVDLVGTYGQLYRPLILGACFELVNLAASFLLYSDRRLISRLLMLCAALCTVGIAVSVYTVVGLNV